MIGDFPANSLHVTETELSMAMMAKPSASFFSISPSSHDYKSHFLNTKPNNGRSIFSIPSRRRVFASAKASTLQAKPSSTLAIVDDANAKITHFCKVGNLREAVESLCPGGSENFELDWKTYCSVLELCAQRKSLKDGKRVHSMICDNGVSVDGYLGEKLVFMYANCGDLREGRRVFDRISSDRVFVWNLMINEYAKIGNFRESISLFRKMQELGIQANSHTLSCIYKCFGALGSVKEGEKVHGFVYKLGFDSYNTVANSLMAFYSKCRRVESARKLFDGMTERDVISWNSMISGYASNGVGLKSVEIFVEMVCSGVGVDLASVVSVLVACAGLGARQLGRAVHGFAVKASFEKEMMFRNTLMDMYCKCGELDAAVRVFERMGERSVVSWTSMIAGYAREGFSDTAIGLFCEMEKSGVAPDIFSVTTILHACACSGSLENGKDVHNYIRENGMESNLFVCNALMDMYAKCGSMEDAHSVFSGMRVKDVISWNTMIGGYSKNCLPNEALELFSKMQRESKPDSTTAACILPACASLAALDRGREIHAHILRNGYFQDRYVANALVDMYVKCGILALSETLFDKIPSKDLISWTVMIAGYGMHGFGREAIAAFNEMRHAGFEPDEISYISILYACSHSGLINEGWRFFDTMRNESNIEPKLEHYACIVDLLSRMGKLSMAYNFIKRMPIKPDATIWGALLCGCRTHHNVKMAEKVAEHVFELEPENTGYYVLLANIYAEAEKWEEVRKLRERIGRRGLKKNPGCSWIEIKGKVSIFVAGDNSHPLGKKIESLLKRLRAKMNEEGFFPNMKYALLNANDMEKEAALCGHSEKLAMAFGMLSLPPGKTIRVTKNLRVCGDCHGTAKFISKISGREILLRDSNRFHHFKDGSCSCRGFW